MDTQRLLVAIVSVLERPYPCGRPGCTALSTGLGLLRRRAGQLHCEHSGANGVAVLTAGVVRDIHVGAGGAIEVEVGSAGRPDSSGAVYMSVGRVRDSDGAFFAFDGSHAWFEDAVRNALVCLAPSPPLYTNI